MHEAPRLSMSGTMSLQLVQQILPITFRPKDLLGAMRQSPNPRSEPRRSTEPPHSTIGWNRLSTANRGVRLSASLASVVQSVEVTAVVPVQSSSLSSVRPANGKCPSVGSEVLGSVSNLAVRGEIPPVVRDSCPWLGSCRVVSFRSLCNHRVAKLPASSRL